MRSPRLLLCAPLALALGGASCAESATGGTPTIVPTALLLDPEDFRGEVPCSPLPGAFQAYVAALVDLAEPSASPPPSGAVPCAGRVRFDSVVDGRAYLAEIDGYDRDARLLVPLPGNPRAMTQDGVVVAPRWTATCGVKAEEEDAGGGADAGEGAAAPAVASKARILRLRACTTLAATSPAPEPAITLDPSGALGGLACGADVATFDIVPEDEGLAPVTSVPCGDGPRTFAGGLEPGTTYRFRLFAFDAGGGAPRWGARCFATAREGVTIPATCDLLTSAGSITLDVEEALATLGRSCGAEATTYDAALPALGLATGARPCGEPTRFAPLEPGEYTISVALRDVNGSPAGSLSCAAGVAAGSESVAACTAP